MHTLRFRACTVLPACDCHSAAGCCKLKEAEMIDGRSCRLGWMFPSLVAAHRQSYY